MQDTHNCVRNPETGRCYVCQTPMRLNFLASSPLEAAIDATQFPRAVFTKPAHTCSCGAVIKASETQCTDCWIAEQTKQPAPAPKASKPQPATGVITLDSILDAMESNPSKWN